MIYGVLNANRDEIGIRYNDYSRAYQEWRRLNEWQICFLVRWMTDTFFIVLEPQR